MPRLTHVLCVLLLATSLSAEARPAVAVEEKQVTPQIVWTYHRPMSELVLGATRSSGIESVLELSDGTLVAYLIESNLNAPLLFRFDGAGKVLWGVRLDKTADDLGALKNQIQPLPGFPAGEPEAGVMVLDTFNVWRVGPVGELPWKRSGERFGLDVVTSMAVLDDQSVVIGGMEADRPCNSAYASLVRLDRYGDRLWLRSFRFSQGWDFAVQTLSLANGYILGLVDPEGPAMFMGSASNPCRDRSGEQHLVWLDRDGKSLGIRDLPRDGTVERLAEQTNGRLAAVVSYWGTKRWSLRFMDAEGTTLSEHSYGPTDFPDWDDYLIGVMDLRVVPDGLLLAGAFSCSGKAYCHRHSITRFFKLGPHGEILRILDTGATHVLGGAFSPDLKSFTGRSSDSQIVRVRLE